MEKEKGQAKGKEKEREKEEGQGCNHLEKTYTFLHLAAAPGTSHSFDDGLQAAYLSQPTSREVNSPHGRKVPARSQPTRVKSTHGHTMGTTQNMCYRSIQSMLRHPCGVQFCKGTRFRVDVTQAEST